MYSYKDYMKDLMAPVVQQRSRKSSSAKSEKDQIEKQGDRDASTQQSNLLLQQRLQMRKASEEFAQQHNVRRSFLFPKNKGIIKIKLGAIFTHREKLPDDYSCFLLQLESIFPCLKPNYRKPSLDEECEKILENPVSEFPPQKLYTVFYLDKNDCHVPLRKDAAYLDFLSQINHDPQIAHPLYGIRIFIVPNEGDQFLNRFSLAGPHEVELDEQMWKLLFTQSNQLQKLRHEKVVQNPHEDEELKESKVLKYDGLEQMEVYLVKKWQESKEGKKKEEDDSIYVSCNLEKSADSIPVESLDSLRESSDRAQIQIKEMNSELDAISEEEYKLMESEHYSSSDESDLDEEQIRQTTRRLIDEMCLGIFNKIRKQELQEEKFKLLFLDRESSSKSSPAKDQESFVQFQDANQYVEDIQFSFVQNPYLQESIQMEEAEDEEAESVVLKPVIDALIEKAEENKQKIDIALDPQDEAEKVEVELKPEEEDNVLAKKEEEENEKQDKVERQVVVPEIPKAEEIPEQNEAQIKKPEEFEQEKVKYFNPGSDEDDNQELVEKLKSNWSKFVSFIKEGFSSNKKKYKWGPFEMAAIVRKIDTASSIMEAEMKRFQIEEPMFAFPSTIHQHRIRIINLSEFTWPEKVWVDMIRGDKKIKFQKQKIELQLKPTEESQISVCFQAPKSTGTYTATFALKGQFHHKELFFGELIDIKIKVMKRDADDLRVKVYADAAKLHEEGLADYQDCLRALRVNNNSYEKARANLLERLYDLEH